MKMCIYMYFYNLTIIRPWIAKVVELFLLFKRFQDWKVANVSECVAKQAENHKLKPHSLIKFNFNAMQMCIYINSCFLTIIRSCIVKVVKLLLFLRGFATEKWLFWWVSHTKSRGYTCIPVTLGSPDGERSEQRRKNRLLPDMIPFWGLIPDLRE
jgi:hypothetical protein